MKTKIYLTIMLALTTILVASAQKQASSPQQAEKAAPQEPAKDKKILITLSANSAKNFATGEATPKSSPTTLPETSSEPNPAEADKLLKQADEMTLMASALRKEAKKAPSDRKNQMMEEAKNLDFIAMTKQIEASDINGKVNLKKYHTNRQAINYMLEQHEGKTVLNHTRFLITESEKNMKIARELRQEASSLTSLPSKLGTMSNAEEKEVIALGNQTEAINMLKKSLH